MSEAVRFALGVLFEPEAVVELRALADTATHSGYFDDPALLADRAATLDALSDVHGVYVTLNEVNPALLARRANRVKQRLSRSDATTADTDIVRRRWLPVDLDPVRPSGVSATDEEHAAALERAKAIEAWLAGLGFPEPVRADSGNGAHLLYRIDLENDDDATALVKQCLATLDTLFSDDVVTVDTANFNAGRIWKLYGTTARKGDNTSERPHRQARLLSVPEILIPLTAEQLRQLASLLPVKASQPKQEKGAGLDLSRWLTDHGITIRAEKPWQGGTLHILDQCPFSSAHKDGAFAIQFGNGAIFAGCHHASCGGGSQRWPELRAMHEKRTTPPPKPPAAPVTTPAADHHQKALDILRTGRPLAFLLDLFNRDHVGDRIVAECLALSVASQSVANTSGLHVAITGDSGKGKSHACRTMLAQIPAEWRLSGSVSNKALYYHDDLRPGTVILFDDIALSDDLQEVLKGATANFREPIEYRTLTKDRKIRICHIPERCVWWLAKVDAPGDDQVMNRMLTVWIDDTREQDEAVLEHMREKESRGPAAVAEDEELMVARALWTVLKGRLVHVTIPFAGRIRFSATANRRNPEMFFDLVKCHALLHLFQREQIEGPDGQAAIAASVADFEAAARLFSALNGLAGGQETKLTHKEVAGLETIEAMGWERFTVRMLQEATGYSYYQARRLLHGYTSKGNVYSGLLEKCPAITVVDTMVSEEHAGVTMRRREHHYSLDRVAFAEWWRHPQVWLERETETTLAPSLQHLCGNVPPESKPEEQDVLPDRAADSESTGTACTNVRTNTGTQKRVEVDPAMVCSVFEHAATAKAILNGEPVAADGHRRPESHMFGGNPGTPSTAIVPPVAIDLAEWVRLPVLVDKPCSVCGARPCPAMKKGSSSNPVLLCSDCLRKAGGGQKKSRALPLPGLLDAGSFERTGKDLGRCDLCGEGKAVFVAMVERVKLCERCYAGVRRGG